MFMLCLTIIESRFCKNILTVVAQNARFFAQLIIIYGR